MNKINNNLLLIIFCIFLINCSFGPTTRIWNDLSKDLEIAKNRENTKLIFSSSKKFDKETKSNEVIRVSRPYKNQNWSQQNFTNGNYVPHLIYQNKKNLIFKSKKLGKNKFNFIDGDFQPIIENDLVFFFRDK